MDHDDAACSGRSGGEPGAGCDIPPQIPDLPPTIPAALLARMQRLDMQVVDIRWSDSLHQWEIDVHGPYVRGRYDTLTKVMAGLVALVEVMEQERGGDR